MNITRLLFLVALPLIGVGCASVFNPKVVTNVEITQRTNPTGQNCPISNYTPAQVERFFVKANKVEYQALHAKSDYDHCSIKGDGMLKKSNCAWEIRAEGTGSIRCGNNIHNYICVNCF